MPARDFADLVKQVEALQAAPAAGTGVDVTARLDKIVKNQTTINEAHAARLTALETKPAVTTEDENPDA